MTDIEVFDNGAVKIKQWWYLMPPHLKAGISEAALFISTPEHIDGVVENNGNLFYNNDGDGNPFDNPLDCSNFNDLRLILKNSCNLIFCLILLLRGGPNPPQKIIYPDTTSLVFAL